MGGTTVGVPDVDISSLPVSSDATQYNLRNASVALNTPQVSAPSGAIGSPALGSTEDLESRVQQSYLNPPSYIPDNQQTFPQQQQPQFQPTPQHSLQPLIDQASGQQAQTAKQGVVKSLFTSFLGGAGRAMMKNAGLDTPEEAADKRTRMLIDLSNAQSNQDLKNLEAEKYRMQVATVPILNEYGVQEDVPQWRADARIAEVNRFRETQLRAQAARDRMTPDAQLYASYLRQGMTEEQASQKMEQMKASGRAPTEAELALRSAQGDATSEAALRRLDKSKRESRPVNQFQMPSGVSSEAAATGGEAVLRNLDPGKAQLIRKIANYELDPAKVTSTRSGERAQVMGLVSLYDSTYDQKLYPARAKVQLDFTSGKTADNITALNTAADHLSQLHDAGVALQNGDVQALNMIANAYQVQAGGSAPVVFDAIKNAVAGELEKAFKGASATDVGTANVLNTIRTNASPDQITAVAATDIHLMKSRLKALEQRYQNGMGKSAPAGLITYPNSQEIFSRIGQTPQSATNPANGHKIVVREGRWVDAQTGAPI